VAELLEILSEEWALRALIASSLVGIMCGMIGTFIVLRNMSLIGDALSHAILPGIVVAFLITGYSTIGFFLGSVIAGLFTAFIITWIQHNVKTKNDASIGIVFTAMFSIGVIGISSLNREEGVHLDLKDFLFGTVMGISNEDIILTAVVCLYTIISIIVFYRYLFISTFQPTIAATMGISVKMIHYFLMLLLSFAVVSALRTVGVILVVAMLITPPATALLLSDKLKSVIALSALIGLVSAIIGLIIAILFDMPPGPAMCLVATFMYFLAGIFAPKKGLLTKFLNSQKQKKQIVIDHILRQVVKPENKAISITSLSQKLDVSLWKLKSAINKLVNDGILSSQNNQVALTAKGNMKAEKLVRAHRLWETYLVDEIGLDDGQIHNEADKLEHYLTEEMLDEVDKKLGYPNTDPHGSPIPKRIHKPKNPLINLKPNARARIAKAQINDYVESELWELNLAAGASFSVKNIESNAVNIQLKNGKSLKLKADLAALINVEH